MSNDEELIELVTKVAEKVPGVTDVVREMSMGGSEDYTMLANRVQEHGGKSEFFILGSDRPGAHHQKNFDIDEKSLGIGFEIYKGCLEHLNK